MPHGPPTTTGSRMSTGYIDIARAQQEHWQRSYQANPRLHGTDPSEPARWTAGRFAAAGIDDVLELGAGHGRDALFLARQGFSVHATDFSEAALDQLRLDAQHSGLDALVTATLHDVRDPLPPADATVGAVYAHLLPSMPPGPTAATAWWTSTGSPCGSWTATWSSGWPPAGVSTTSPSTRNPRRAGRSGGSRSPSEIPVRPRSLTPVAPSDSLSAPHSTQWREAWSGTSAYSRSTWSSAAVRAARSSGCSR